jgi:CRP/FNR family cyclic AMP-dependent transcriptional regulator
MPEAKRLEMLESSPTRTENRRRDCDVILSEIVLTKPSNLNSLHPPGRVLFEEGEPARGVYLLRSGSASVFTSSTDGRVLILRIARAGDLLGLNSVLRESAYDSTVKILEAARTDFISRGEFIDLMDQSKSVNRAVLAILSKELADFGERAKSLLLSQTTSSRLAKLLLEWSLESEAVEVGFVRIEKRFTHEQIAQMIGSSRETVTRLFAAFRKNQLIRVTPAGISIVDATALENMALGSPKMELDSRMK